MLKEAGLELGVKGAVKVNDHMQSVSDPDIFVVGDVVETNDVITNKRVNVPLGTTISFKMNIIVR